MVSVPPPAAHRAAVLPPVYVSAAVLAMLVLHVAIPGRRVIVAPWLLLGVVPLLLGTALNVLADRTFKTSGTSVKPFERSTHLVTDGVFALSRHPMWLGMVLILAGVAVVLGTLTPFAVVLAFAILLDVRFIRAEEGMLADTFGDRWRRYRSRVRRWL
ncbi:MAG TPA: methyltransferase [bacterium]|nr:methyltransferase [bacterium]